MARNHITIVLELDGTVDSPVGTARLPDGTRRSFHGWLGLAAAIDALAARPAPDDEAPPSAASSRGLDHEPGNQP
jgi:hypothetical protein